MEKRRFSWILLLLLCSFSQLQAQWDVPFGQYWAVRSALNPAFAGEEEAIRTAALYRYQWNGIGSAPRQILLTTDMPFEFLRKRHGTGLVAYTETVGKLRNTLLAAQYSFRQQIGNGFLNIGLQAGAYKLTFDAGSKHITADSLQQGRSMLKVRLTDQQVIELSAGISWTGNSAFAGLSAMHINQPRFYTRNDSLSTNLQGDSALSVIPRSYNLVAGYNITLFHPLEIEPMVWAQTNFSTLQLQATLRLAYDNKFSGGASWRMDDGYLFFAGTTIRGVEMGYAYGLHTKGPGKNSKGSHELYLRYNFPLDHFKPKRQPQKSIRLL